MCKSSIQKRSEIVENISLDICEGKGDDTYQNSKSKQQLQFAGNLTILHCLFIFFGHNYSKVSKQ